MTESEWKELLAPFGRNIVLDIGTGDGLFVYHSAKSDASTLFIGLDANIKPLEKISQKITRRMGVPNALYLRASIENLPDELSGLARQVYVNFPWGSLLGAVLGLNSGLHQLKKVCAASGQLNSILSFDPEKDRAEWLRLGIELPELEWFKTNLNDVYRNAGFDSMIEYCSEPGPIQTSWSKRLQNNPNRIFLRIAARCV